MPKLLHAAYAAAARSEALELVTDPLIVSHFLAWLYGEAVSTGSFGIFDAHQLYDFAVAWDCEALRAVMQGSDGLSDPQLLCGLSVRATMWGVIYHSLASFRGREMFLTSLMKTLHLDLQSATAAPSPAQRHAVAMLSRDQGLLFSFLREAWGLIDAASSSRGAKLEAMRLLRENSATALGEQLVRRRSSG